MYIFYDSITDVPFYNGCSFDKSLALALHVVPEANEKKLELSCHRLLHFLYPAAAAFCMNGERDIKERVTVKRAHLTALERDGGSACSSS
jgi:hypothetical protein